MRSHILAVAVVLGWIGPLLAQEPAPSWVRPGTRLTYHGMGSNIETESRLYGPGEILNFTPTPEWLRKGNNAWEGLQQLNVVAVAGDRVVLSVRRYVMVRAGVPALFEASSDIQPLGTAGEYWRHPDVLRRALISPPAGFLAARMPITIAGVTHQGIQFGLKTDTGQTIYVYDEQTGVLLRTGTISQEKVFRRHPVTGQMTHLWEARSSGLTLIDRRQIDWPWADSPAPDWIRDIRDLNYQGISILAIPGAPPYRLPISVQMQISNRGVDWLEQRTSITKAGIPPLPSDTAVARLPSGRAQLGGVFLPPANLSRLRSGQILDRDPYTKTEVAVASLQNDPRGRPILTITETGPTQRFEYRYDAQTGLLIGFLRDDQHAFTRTNLNLAE